MNDFACTLNGRLVHIVSRSDQTLEYFGELNLRGDALAGLWITGSSPEDLRKSHFAKAAVAAVNQFLKTRRQSTVDVQELTAAPPECDSFDCATKKDE